MTSLEPFVAVSRISGLLGRNKGLARVQAELQTVHSNIRCSKGKTRETWQRIFDGYPQRNRDTFARNREKLEAAELLISHDETVRAAVENVTRSAKGSVSKFMELGSVMESTTAYAEPVDEDTAREAEQDEALLKLWKDEVKAAAEAEEAAADPACYEDPSAVAELEHPGMFVAAVAAAAPKPRVVATDAMIKRALGMKGIENAVKMAAANRRGHFLEDDTLATMDAVGTKRRGKIKLECGIILRGECDGVHEDRIIEVKNYMYPVHGPPSDKHFIQLHAYMKMFGKRRGCISRQYEGKVTNDDVDFDDARWDEITEGLAKVRHRWVTFGETGKWPSRPRKKAKTAPPPPKKKVKSLRGLLGM